MDLFLDSLPQRDRDFRKTATLIARMSEQPENWQQEVESELLKQLPFLSDYAVNVALDKVEPQRGYAFGYGDISNVTQRPEDEHQDAGLPHIRIPIIIEERALKPFAVFLDGEAVIPLTEDRIRETLFNPTTFDLTETEPRDPSLVDSLMPPARGGPGQGGEYKTASADPDAILRSGFRMPKLAHATKTRAVEAKQKVAFQHISQEQWAALYQNPKIQKLYQQYGSWDHPEVENVAYELASKMYGYHPKTASVLGAIAPTIREADAQAFVEKVASDHTLQAGFRRSGVGPLLIEVFEKTKRASLEEGFETLADSILPTVTTIQKLPGNRFLVKQANVDAFVGGQDAQGQVVDGQTMAGAIGQDTAQGMRPGDVMTATSDPVQQAAPPSTKAKLVAEFGEYKVQDLMGNHLLGWVFPHTLAWDGAFTPTAVALFTNGSAYAVQDTIAGELVGKGTNLPVGMPRGEGVFYHVEDGEAICTAPVTIRSSVAGPDGLPRLVATDIFGAQFTVGMSQGLKSPIRVGDTEYLLPDWWKFMRLNNQTQIVQDPSQMLKTAALRSAFGEATLFFNGSFNLKGECGLEKISRDFRYDLDPVEAEFMLGLLGVDGAQASHLVKEARRKGSIKLAGLKTITTFAERYQSAEKVASAVLAQVPNLRRDLVKEAASLEDESTVDHILALNFINPENLMTFVGYIPEFEKTARRLAEMWLSSAVGERALPDSAIERSMKGLEEVIQGLKAVQHAES